MKQISQLVAVWLLACTIASGESTGSSVFEIRLVVDTATAHTMQMTLIQERKDGGKTKPEVLNVQKTPLMDGTAIRSTAVQKSHTTGDPYIEITFTDQGRERFAEVTKQNIGKRLAIVIEGKLLSAPRIMAEITGGIAQITGRFSEQEAKDLAAKINAAVQK